VYPPKDDTACFTNHSHSNNLSAVFDRRISVEPIFVANRDIKKGEELTDNYLEFGTELKDEKPSWL
jgi:SET domain-containing protein